MNNHESAAKSDPRKPPKLPWKRLEGKFPSMRQQIAEGKHPEFGEFTLGMCAFTGALWVGVSSAGGESTFWSVTPHQLMDAFFGDLEARAIDGPRGGDERG